MKKNGCEDIRARSYNRHKKYVKKKKKATRSGRGKDGRRCWLYGLRQMQHTHPRVQIVAIYGQGISPPPPNRPFLLYTCTQNPAPLLPSFTNDLDALLWLEMEPRPI